MFRFTFVVTFLAALLLSPVADAQNLLNNPESVVFDASKNRYLVSNWGDGAVVEIDSNGDQNYFNTDLQGNHNIAGLHIAGDILYAACNNGPNRGLVQFDLATGDTLSVTFILGMSLLNDITSDTSGNLYVTDYYVHKIFQIRISDQSPSVFVGSGLYFPNGILFDASNNRLLVISEGSAGGPILAISLVDTSAVPVAYTDLTACDGLAEDDEGNIYFSSWTTNRVYRFDKDFSGPAEVVSTGHNDPADIFFNKRYSELAIPCFTGNTVDLITVEVGLFTRVFDIDPVRDGGSSRGVSWVDYDNDNYLDLFVTNLAYPADPEENNCLYHNNGDGTFSKSDGDIITSDGGHSRTSTWGDYDNDGDIDAFVANWPDQANFLYQNNGNGTFTKVTDGQAVNEIEGSPAASWADYDNDGRLDLYVANYGTNSLYHNEAGTLTSVTTGNIVTDIADSYGAAWGDYDSDRNVDLFVANNNGNHVNSLYKNNADSTFAGVTGQEVVIDEGSSFGGSWGDYDNDGDLDLFVPNLWSALTPGNLLYNNDGYGVLARVTDGDIVSDTGSSRGSAWGDYDNDGDLDLFVTNDSDIAVNFLYENDGTGVFARITTGELVNDVGSWSGAAWGDYDRDGDLDLMVASCLDGDNDNVLYRNNGNGNSWINIKCIGTVSNTSAIGAKVLVKAAIDGTPVRQLREISAQTGYCAQSSLDAHFGLGDATVVDSIVIEWPSGIVRGDADGSEDVDIDDVVFLINYIFSGGAAPDPIASGDADCAGGIDIDDVVYLIAYIFSGGNAPCDTDGDELPDC
jgi:hypothetical protein